MSRLSNTLIVAVAAFVFSLVEPCIAQSTKTASQAAAPRTAAPEAGAPQAAAPQAGAAAQIGNAPQTRPDSSGGRSSRARSRDRNNHWHSNEYYVPSTGYYPYSVPYSFGYGGNGGYYPYGYGYSNYGYPINLNSGLERGFKYGNTYINPNFGN